MTIFLRHDESKTLDEINAHLEKTGFQKNFQPQGVEVVSWYVMMGIGQVITLRFPAAKLRNVNPDRTRSMGRFSYGVLSDLRLPSRMGGLEEGWKMKSRPPRPESISQE